MPEVREIYLVILILLGHALRPTREIFFYAHLTLLFNYFKQLFPWVGLIYWFSYLSSIAYLQCVVFGGCVNVLDEIWGGGEGGDLVGDLQRRAGLKHIVNATSISCEYSLNRACKLHNSIAAKSLCHTVAVDICLDLQRCVGDLNTDSL